MMSVKLYRIFGAGVDFECYTDEAEALCTDIFNHASKYSEHADYSEASYYEFTKFLWVATGGEEWRLAEIATGDDAYPVVNFNRITHNGKVYYISDKNLDAFNAQYKAEYAKAEARALIRKTANAIGALLDEEGASLRVSGYVYSLLTEAAHCCRNWLEDNKEQAWKSIGVRFNGDGS